MVKTCPASKPKLVNGSCHELVEFITGEEGFKRASKEQGINMIDFEALYCPYCQKLAEMLKRMELKYGERAEFYFVDINDKRNASLVSRFDVTSVPRVYVFKDGKPKGKYAGLHDINFYEEIVDKLLKK